MMQALQIIGDSWPIAAMVMTVIITSGICWLVRKGSYNHQAYLRLKEEHNILLGDLRRKFDD
jgi:hypothetical protein